MIKRSKLRLVLCSILLALTVCFIWGNSIMNGEASGSISGGFGAWIGKIIPFLSPDSPNGHFILRKCAHFSIFFVLGLELCWLLSMLTDRKVILRCLAVAAAVAAIDESIQRFVPGRYGCLSDMLIDLSGAAAGIVLLFLGYTLLHRKKLKREQTI